MDIEQTKQQKRQQEIDFDQLEYQKCPYCMRSFFAGKLKYHLKLCNQTNPMLISPKKSPNLQKPSKQSEREVLFSNKEKKCPKCSTKLPAFLFDRHIAKCQSNSITAKDKISIEEVPKSSTEVNFKDKETTLPVIKSINKNTKNTSIFKKSFQVQLREELSCFRRAAEVKQVECSSCGRVFSFAASQRHIPICTNLKNNQILSIALKKRSSKNNSVVLKMQSTPKKKRKDQKSNGLDQQKQ